eukprot:360766-Chlamydomonas_euryale.AAC.7
MTSSRPMTGSSSPRRASLVKSRPYRLRAEPPLLPRPELRPGKNSAAHDGMGWEKRASQKSIGTGRWWTGIVVWGAGR